MRVQHCRDVVAAVSNAGGFGILGAVAHSPKRLESELTWIEEHTGGKPYGVDVLLPPKYIGAEQGGIDAQQARELIPEGIAPSSTTCWFAMASPRSPTGSVRPRPVGCTSRPRVISRCWMWPSPMTSG